MGKLHGGLTVQSGVPPDLIHQNHDLLYAFYRLGHRMYFAPEWPREFAPDFILLNEAELWSWTPNGLFHESPPADWRPKGLDIPIIVWCHDPFLNFRKELVVAKGADAVLVSQKPWVENFRQEVPAGVPVYWLNAAAVNTNLMLPESAEVPEEYDVGFVGAVSHPYYADRQRLLGKLEGAGLKVFVHDSSKRPPLYRRDMIAAYSKCKIVFNHVRPDTMGTGNARIYEAVAARKLLLTNWLPGVRDLGFEPGVHYAEYGTDDECVELALRYARDDGGRRKIAAAAVEFALREHTWEARAAKIIEIAGPMLG